MMDDSEDYEGKIIEMLSNSRWAYAEEFLSSVLDWIQETGFISEGQMTGVDNVYDSPSGGKNSYT